jgi:hypothetical protein
MAKGKSIYQIHESHRLINNRNNVYERETKNFYDESKIKKGTNNNF